MAEEIYFIKTNPIIAKINLYNKLCREEKNVLYFLDEDKKTSFEIIKTKVSESIESLTKEELLCIFSWFNNEYQSNREEVKTQLFINGIDIFYEILSEVDVKNFHEILFDYENYTKQNIDFIVDSQNFNQFLVYGIFYTDMMKKESNKILSNYLKLDYKVLYSFAENQFNSKNQNLETENTIPNLYHYFVDLYDLTKFYKGCIIKLHNQ